MRLDIDLHCHSTASDGTLPPAALVARARDAGLRTLALTDHDCVAGLGEAEAAAQPAGLRLIAGVELSVTWQARTLHILGLGIRPQDAGLGAGLARLQAFRQWRAAEIARRLERAGVPEPLAGARRLMLGEIPSRSHFARYLVACGKARDFRDGIRKWLRQGRPGHVAGQWAALDEAVGWIRGAGGVAVIAHPARYELSATRLRLLLTEFKAAGGEGIEVLSGSHGAEEVRHYTGVALRYGLLASAGSDYHGPGEGHLELGRLPLLPEGLTPVWRHPALAGAVEAGRAA